MTDIRAMQGGPFGPGSRVEFTRPDGVVVQDTVRELHWNAHHLEPYARDEWFVAAVLTEHSWAKVADLRPIREESKPRCLRCGLRLLTGEGRRTGICAECWDAETDGEE